MLRKMQEAREGSFHRREAAVQAQKVLGVASRTEHAAEVDLIHPSAADVRLHGAPGSAR